MTCKLNIIILGMTLLFLSQNAAHAEITIALAGPLTGAEASFGEQMRQGAEQAVADINAGGGINGEKLILQEMDDACDPKQAVVVANKIVNMGIKFVFGHACSGASIAASKVYNEENIFMITPFSTNPDLTEAGFKNVFRTCGRDDEQGAVQARYVLQHLKNKKIAIMNDNTAVGLGLARQFKKNLNLGGVQEDLFDSYTPGEKDYSSLVTKLKQHGIQVLEIGGYHVEAALILRQAKAQGVDIQVISDDDLSTPEFWSITGDAGEGTLLTFYPDPRKHAEAKTFIAEMQKNGHEPEGYTFYSYAAIEVIAEGIRRGGKDPLKVSEALRRQAVRTIVGALHYDEKGDVIGTNYIVYRWHNGKYIEAEK